MTSRIAANFARPTKEDLLYQTEYDHGVSDICIDCDRSKLVTRPSRDYEELVIHYGLIFQSITLFAYFESMTKQSFPCVVHRFNVPLDLTAVPVITNFVGRAVSDRYDIGEFFPKADHGSILGLTKLGEPFPVPRLDSYNLIQLLLQSSGLLARNTTSKLNSNPGTIAPNK
ncbi:hypothetical protein N7522_007545 [Penicillium canescens]|nr:hypothetical protein N7522_007545 [Penicillium canescens]